MIMVPSPIIKVIWKIAFPAAFGDILTFLWQFCKKRGFEKGDIKMVAHHLVILLGEMTFFPPKDFVGALRNSGQL